jgi:O-antigen/teichoic acid export membrane protein
LSKIRVTYSGLIALTVGLVSVITGIVFTLIVTRQLTADEFGTWALIGGLLSYVIITETTISYWTTREIARGNESGRTALFASGVFSTVGIAIYIVIAYLVALQQNLDTEVLLLGGIIVPLFFLNRTLTAINYGWKPQIVSYGILSVELAKIPAGLILVYILDLGLAGAIQATAIAYFVSVILQLICARSKLRNSINFQSIKKWIKFSWIPLYPGISNFLHKLDVLIFSAITGSVTGLAYYAAANTISSLVAQTGGISRALYPKLLESEQREYLKENLTRLFYFALPFSAISITFAKPALFALNPIYEIAAPVVIFLTGKMFLANLSSVFYQSLIGIEKVDVNENSTWKDYVKSKLFLVPTILIIQGIIFVASIILGIIILLGLNTAELDLVMFWSISIFVVQIPFTAYLYKLVKKNFKSILDLKAVTKYFVSTFAIFIPIYFLTENFLEYKISIFEFLPDLMVYVVIGIAGYLGLTYLIDSKTRVFFKAILHELVKK